MPSFPPAARWWVAHNQHTMQMLSPRLSQHVGMGSYRSTCMSHEWNHMAMGSWQLQRLPAQALTCIGSELCPACR